VDQLGADRRKWGLFLMRTDPTCDPARRSSTKGITTFIIDMEFARMNPSDPRDHRRLAVLRGVLHRRRIPVGDRLGDEGTGGRLDGRLDQERVGQRGAGDLDGADLARSATAKAENPDALRDPRSASASRRCTSRSRPRAC